MNPSSPSDGRLRTATLGQQDTSFIPPLDPPSIAPPSAGRHAAARDLPPSRGRASSASNPHNASPRAISAQAQSPAGRVGDPGLQRKPSQSYGHHRQTSIVNGQPHSRNHSLLSSVHTSPLSPQKATAAGMPDVAVLPMADITKSPATPALAPNSSNTAVLPMNKSFDSASLRKPQRVNSRSIRQNHEHQRSLSGSHTPVAQTSGAQEPTTVGEYALHHLFTNFIGVANERIELCIAKPGEREPRVESVCGPGADSAFDQLITSLGHINRHKPKSLIDAMIRWRKGKADIANAIASDLQSARNLTGSPLHPMSHGSFSASALPPGPLDVPVLEQNLAIADRRSAVSIYILCRVLIEAIGQTTLTALNGSEPDGSTAARLEAVIYSQMHNPDPESLASSPLRKANWVIRSQLLGVMSGLRFDQVVEKYIQDIDKAHKRLSVKGMGDAKLAAKTAMLVQSMRWLKFRATPESAWQRSCDTLLQLARFFAEVHGRVMKHAYAELFEHLLLSIAGTVSSELNLPKWKEVLATIQPKITQMMSKADHWPHVFPLQTVLLCVSPADQFAAQWLTLAASSLVRAKDRSGRSHVLKAICRLVWRYLYQHEEAPHVVLKRLEELVKLTFQGGKRFLISTDPLIADPLIQLTRIIGFKYQDLCFRSIIFPLMNADLFFNADSQLKIESLDPERTVIAIRSFLAIMSDLETGRMPRFPTSFECDALVDPTSRTPITHRRTKSQGFAVSAGRTERLSQPVLTSNLNDNIKEYYSKFCKLLGQLTIVCDNTFGGQAVLEERITTTHTPKTPMAEAFNFNKRDDLSNPTDVRQHYYDLFHVAVEALPRCLSPHLPISSLVNLLCTGTAHVQTHIANTSVQSLKSIARQAYAQQVTIGFARFIFAFDDRYATVSDSSLLGPGHIEGTLNIYVELLKIWIDHIREKTRSIDPKTPDGDQNLRQVALDKSSIMAHVDEIESHGLFFLCSPSTAVRAIALVVLRLVTEFDAAVGREEARVIGVIEQIPDLKEHEKHFVDAKLTAAERSRLRKASNKGDAIGILPELCSSTSKHDTALWFKAFPDLVRRILISCSSTAVLTRELVCQRLSHSYRLIGALADGNRQLSNAPLDLALPAGRQGVRFSSTQPEVIIEQWKIHLIFACLTVTNQGQGSKSSHGTHHSRKSSKSSSSSQDKITSASDLFSKAVPFLAVQNATIRSAAITGLGASNRALFSTLLQALQPYVMDCNNEVKERVASHQRNGSISRRTRRADTLRTDVTHLLSLVCRHLEPDSTPGLVRKPTLEDDFPLIYLLDYAKYLRIYLNDSDVQSDLDMQRCRIYFCALVQALYDNVRSLKDSIRYMSFASRQALFSLMENWCGFSPNERQLRQHEEHVRRSMLEMEPDIRRQGVINSGLEKQRIELQHAALDSMASLCAGPLSFIAEGRILNSFDLRRLIAWVASIFENASDVAHTTGRKALKNLIVHNMDHPQLFSQTMRTCYTTKNTKALTSYFEVVNGVVEQLEQDAQNEAIAKRREAEQIVAEESKKEGAKEITEEFLEELVKELMKDTPCAARLPLIPSLQMICLCLHMLGNESNSLRMTASRLLSKLESHRPNPAATTDFDIGISDRTAVVYKMAQFEMSQTLAAQHPDESLYVLSELSATFNELRADQQRSTISLMIPWIQRVQLQEGPDGRPIPASYASLANLFEMTVKNSVALQGEVQTLWQALAAGSSGANVRVILSFLIDLCLEKREKNLVIYVKEIIVFLAKTSAGQNIIDHLLLSVAPRNMVTEQRLSVLIQLETLRLPYVADLELVLPSGAKQNGMSLAQLCMVLLVDLIVPPFVMEPEHLPTLLHMAVIQWDQHLSIVQDQARELIVHLIHELIVPDIDPLVHSDLKTTVDRFISDVRGQQANVGWEYSETEVGSIQSPTRAVIEPMSTVVNSLVDIFATVHPNIRAAWGRVAVEWATNCAVQHAACRSLQIFRCLATPIGGDMLNAMLHRLSRCIADAGNAAFPLFSMEILTSIRIMIGDLPREALIQYPHFFWIACASLDSTAEVEYQEGLGMLEVLIEHGDMRDVDLLHTIQNSQPATWDGFFQGVHVLLHKGVQSRQSMVRTINLMNRLVDLPPSDIVGHGDRLLCTVLANLPSYLRHLEPGNRSSADCADCALMLASVAEGQNQGSLAQVLRDFAASRYRSAEDFLAHCVAAIQSIYFPRCELEALVFLLGMVNNQCDWFKKQTLKVLKLVIAQIDMRRPELGSQGPDLISPLLRLLHTEYCQQALEVLDSVLDMTGTALNSKHLRMSMAGSHSSRATRKEYENTKSLYGIPEESGWSVPMPALRAERTRRNILSIAESLDNQSLSFGGEMSKTPEVEFQDVPISDSYFGNYSDGLEYGDGNMGELARKLDSLDDFFDEQEDDESPVDPMSESFSTGLIDQRENVYDEQALPILRRSLGRNPSIASFRTGFNDSAYIPLPDPVIANAAAFAPNGSLPVRPGMHNRSITSPVALNKTALAATQIEPFYDYDTVDDVESFSDDELTLERTRTMDEADPTTVKPAGFKAGFRQGLRRLTSTGGKSEAREAVKTKTQARSPKVPQLPAAFLAQPMSAEP